MNQDQITDFLTKYAEGTHTPQEHLAFQKWLNALPENELPEVLDYLSQYIQDHPGPDIADSTRLIHEIEDKINNLDFPRSEEGKLSRFLKSASFKLSAAVLLFSAGFLILVHRKNISPKYQPVVISQKIIPGRNQAFVILSDGSRISLDKAHVGLVAADHGVQLKKTDSGTLKLLILAGAKSQAGNIHIVVPRGGQFKLILSDGSVVWLNSATDFKVPLFFSTANRTVFLAGEGYFQVAKNRAKPFRVLSKNTVVQVYGTHFDISAYNDDNEVKATLLEGSVKVICGKLSSMLVPGEQAVVTNRIQKSKANTLSTVAWKNGGFDFAHEDIHSIMKKIARWYNIEVTYGNGVTRDGFFGSIPRSSQIDSVLKMLEITKTVHFKVEGRRVTVMR